MKKTQTKFETINRTFFFQQRPLRQQKQNYILKVLHHRNRASAASILPSCPVGTRPPTSWRSCSWRTPRRTLWKNTGGSERSITLYAKTGVWIPHRWVFGGIWLQRDMSQGEQRCGIFGGGTASNRLSRYGGTRIDRPWGEQGPFATSRRHAPWRLSAIGWVYWILQWCRHDIVVNPRLTPVCVKNNDFDAYWVPTRAHIRGFANRKKAPLDKSE